MNVENILKLAALLESPQAEKHFSMYDYIHVRDDLPIEVTKLQEVFKDCGTEACIAGWAAFLAKPHEVIDKFDIRQVAVEYLELDPYTSAHLFVAGVAMSVTDPKDAALVIRNLIATGKVDWSLVVDEDYEEEFFSLT